MKYYLSLFLSVCCITNNLYSLSDVEKMYTEAVDLKYLGDLAKSRHLLETLQDQGVKNEFLFAFIISIYKDYLLDLIKKKDFQTLRIGYLGIRANLQLIFDEYPNNVSIQNDILLIADLMQDREFLSKMTGQILEKDSENLLANHFAGVQAMQNGDIPNAISFFLNVNQYAHDLSQDPFIFISRQYLGNLYQKQDDYNRALFYYRKALEITSTPELIILTTIAEMYFCNFSEAIQLLEQLPDSLLTTQLCDLYVMALKGKNTIESLEKMTLLLSKIKVQTPFAKAIVKDILGDTEAALTLLSEIQALSEVLPWTYYTFQMELLSRLGREKDKYLGYKNLGFYFLRTNNINLAHELLLKIPDDYDTNGDVAYMLGNIYSELHENNNAMVYYAKALSKNKDLSFYRGYIESLARDGNFGDAEKLIEEASQLEHYHNRWWTLYMFATVRSLEKKYAESEKYLQDLLVQFPNEPLFSNFLAVLYIEQEKYQEAERLLEDTYTMYTYDVTTVNNLVYLYALTRKEYVRSLELILSMMQQFPDNIMLMDTLAWVYFQHGELELAQAIFEDLENKILEKDIHMLKNVEILVHLSIFYKAIGNQQQSDIYFQKALSIDPDNSYLKKVLVGELE